MKMFKRFAAALLVGVMALAMLTACSSGGTTLIGKEFENKVVEAIGTATGQKLENDDGLRAKGLVLLDNIKADGTIAEDDAFDEDDDETYSVMVITEEMMARFNVLAEDGENDAAAEKLYHAQEVNADMISKIVGLFKTMTSEDSDITKIGVATKSLNGKTYAAIAVEYDMSEVA